MKLQSLLMFTLLVLGLPIAHARDAPDTMVRYRTEKIDGVDVFYRDAGPRDAPVVVLLHGFPTSSHMFRDLIPRLADRYRVIAPDYPGYGFSEQPDRSKFAYTFEHYSKIVDQLLERTGAKRYTLYVMDYGAPVGFRLATAHPERVAGFVVQNGNAYMEGFGAAFWAPIMKYWKSGSSADRQAIRWLTTRKATHWQYTNGVRDLSRVSPDAEELDQARLDRPGNADVQLDLFYDYRTNVPLYPGWQAYFRKYKPPMLIVWGQNDEIFPASGAPPYARDLPVVETHMLDTGHFALETHAGEIATWMRTFLARTTGAATPAR